MTMANQQTAVLLRTVLRQRQGLFSEGGGDGCVCIISEHARSSGRCHDCPHWLRSPSSGGALRCQRTLTAATSPFSHSPVLSLELLPPAGHLSLFSTSSSCSGTTPLPTGWSRQKMSNLMLLKREQTVTKAIKKQKGILTTWVQLSLKVWQLFPLQRLCVDVVFHLPLGVYLFFPDSTASTVFTSLRLMIKLLLKTVYTSSSSRGPLSVDTCAWREGRKGGASFLSRRVGLFLGSVILRGAGGHMVRKLVDSTNVCLEHQGRTTCWVSPQILYKPLGLFWEQERSGGGQEKGHLYIPDCMCMCTHTLFRQTSAVPVLLDITPTATLTVKWQHTDLNIYFSLWWIRTADPPV